ncbi:MAG: choice-of-anchor D domain-containing protein [Armatimonadota bacterium]
MRTADGRVVRDGEIVDFGRTALGTPVLKALTITNVGTLDLSLSSLDASGTNGYFTLTQAPSLPATLSPGASANLTLRYEATAGGTQSGPFVVRSNDTRQDPFGFVLRGTTVAPSPGAQPIQCQESWSGRLEETDALSLRDDANGRKPYADRYVFQATAGQRITLTLQSPAFDAYLNLIGPDGQTLVARNNDVGVADPDNPQPGPSGTDARLVYTFTAGQDGFYFIEASSNLADQTGAYTLTLACENTTGGPSIALDFNGAEVQPGELCDFGITPQGVPVVKTFTIRNTGTADLYVTRLYIGAGGDFRPTQTGTAASADPIKPGQSRSFDIRFGAGIAALHEAVLQLSSNVPGAPQPRNPFTVTLRAIAAVPGVPTLTGFTITPPSVVGGRDDATGTVTLSMPAPPGGFRVLIAPDADVPEAQPAGTEVIVPAGQSSASVTIRTAEVAAQKLADQITASAGGVVKAASLTLLPNPDSGTLAVTLTIAPPEDPYGWGGNYVAPADIAMTVEATPSAGHTITRVVILKGSVQLGEATRASGQSGTWSFTWRGAPEGTHGLKARAYDSKGANGTSSEQSVTVDGTAQSSAPYIQHWAGYWADGGGSFTGPALVRIEPAQQVPGDGTAIYYTIDGSAPAPDAPGTLRYTAPFVLRASATVKARVFAGNGAGSDTDTDTFTITNGGTPQPVTVQIHSPADQKTVTEPTMVMATVTGAAAWQLAYRMVSENGSNDAPWTPINGGTDALANQNAGWFDPTLLLNGVYEIQLTGHGADGTIQSAKVTVIVDGGMKIGHLSFSVVDLTVPVAGIPITITRTYDSRDKRLGDFGYGWTLSLSNARLQKNGALSEGWRVVGAGLSARAEARRPHIISVTLPGGQVYAFAAQLVSVNLLTSVRDAQVQYVPVGQTPRGATLEPLGYSSSVSIQLGGGGNATLSTLDEDGFGGDEYNPTSFLLTLRDGTQMRLSDEGGLESITDRNGNTLVFSAGGVAAYSGTGSLMQSVSFTRDGSGVIQEIRDPKGNVIRYQQGGGNLVAVTNRVGDTTSYEYDGNHHLTAIRDPRGVLPMRNVYDADGRLLYTLDARNNKIQFQHDIAGKRETITDASGHQTTLYYDSWGNTVQTDNYVTKYVNGQAVGSVNVGGKASYSSEAGTRGLPLSMTDALGRMTSMEYSPEGDLLSTTNAANETSTSTYDRYGRPLTTIDPEGRVTTTNTYDIKGNLQTTANALGFGTQMTYYANGWLQSVTDAKGAMTEFLNYNNLGQPTVVRGPSGTVEYLYDANGNKLQEARVRTNAQNQAEIVVTRRVYDAEDRIVETIQPDGAATRTEYNSIGQVAVRYDAHRRAMRYGYDAVGRQQYVTKPDGITTETVYDDNGRVQETRTPRITETGVMGLLIDKPLYDEAGRSYGSQTWSGIPGQTGSIQLSESFTNVDAEGQGESSIDVRGIVSGLTQYDPAGRVYQAADALGHATKSRYDKAGRQMEVEDALGRVTTTRYDDAGQVLSTSTPLATSSTAYDELGRTVSQTDGSGRTTQFLYDIRGMLESVTDSGGHTTTYGYDELGHKVRQTDSNGHTTWFAYDINGRLTGRRLPLGQTESMVYRRDGRLQSKTDMNGRLTTFSYDEATGRLLGRSGVNGSVSYTYWPDGSRKTATRNGVTLQYFHDVRGRLVQVTSPTGTITYGYDAAGNKTSMTTPTGTVGWRYDELGYLTAVIHRDMKETRYRYNEVGNRVETRRPNGVVTTYGYDDGDRLESVANSVGSSFYYSLDGAGRRTSVTDSKRGTTIYSYDAAARLVREAGPSGTITYGYDAVGNRLSKSVAGGATTGYGYDDNDRLKVESVNGTVAVSYDYDDQGNLTTRTEGGVTTVLSYDFEDKILGTSVGGETRTSYSYDAEGNRVTKTVIAPAALGGGSTTTSYLVDTTAPFAAVLEETAGGQTARYEYGLELVRLDRGNGVYYYIYDGLGSTVALADANGQVPGQGALYAYDAFGSLVGGDPPFQPFLFNGQQLDMETGLYFLRARYYAPGMGRFLSQDPYAGHGNNPVSLHRYLYGANDPINNTDPSGKETLVGFLTSSSMRAGLISSMTGGVVNVGIDLTLSLYMGQSYSFSDGVISFGVGFVTNAATAAAGKALQHIVKAVLKNKPLYVYGVEAYSKEIVENGGRRWATYVAKFRNKAHQNIAIGGNKRLVGALETTMWLPLIKTEIKDLSRRVQVPPEELVKYMPAFSPNFFSWWKGPWQLTYQAWGPGRQRLAAFEGLANLVGLRAVADVLERFGRHPHPEGYTSPEHDLINPED